MEGMIAFDDVEVLEELDLGVRCRVDGREVFVGNLVLDPRSTVRRKGDRGKLVVPRWFALQNGFAAG